MPSIKRRAYCRWDGESKGKTKDCDKCDFKVNFWDKEVCCWGISFKYLYDGKNMRKCEYVGKKPPENNSLKYVLYAKKHHLFGRARGKDAIQLSLNFNGFIQIKNAMD